MEKLQWKQVLLNIYDQPVCCHVTSCENETFDEHIVNYSYFYKRIVPESATNYNARVKSLREIFVFFIILILKDCKVHH